MDKPSSPEQRLFQLYQRERDELVEESRNLDLAANSDAIQSRAFSEQEFLAYLIGPVWDEELRRCLLRRILDFAEPEERAELQRAVRSILEEPADLASSSIVPRPHFGTSKASPKREARN